MYRVMLGSYLDNLKQKKNKSQMGKKCLKSLGLDWRLGTKRPTFLRGGWRVALRFFLKVLKQGTP